MFNFDKKILIHSFFSFLFGMMGAFLISTFTNPSVFIAMVDIVGIEDSFIKETSRQTLSDDQKKTAVDQFATALQESIQELSRKKRLVLVPNQAVLAGGKDMTREVMVDVKRRMNK